MGWIHATFISPDEQAILNRLLNIAEDSDYFSSSGKMPGRLKTDAEVTETIKSIREKLKL